MSDYNCRVVTGMYYNINFVKCIKLSKFSLAYLLILIDYKGQGYTFIYLPKRRMSTCTEREDIYLHRYPTLGGIFRSR